MNEEYEELKTLLKLYFQIYDDDGTLYSDDEWERLLREIEIDIRNAIGFFDIEE
jgi:hypothetical protein